MAKDSVYFGGRMEITGGHPSYQDFVAIKARLDAIEATLNTASTGLSAVVGDADSGLVKAVADLQTVVGDASAGLVKRVSDLEAAAETPAAGES